MDANNKPFTSTLMEYNSKNKIPEKEANKDIKIKKNIKNKVTENTNKDDKKKDDKKKDDENNENNENNISGSKTKIISKQNSRSFHEEIIF